MKYIVTNFAYGFGPFLRTTEIALAINDQLKILGREPLGIIVPWVYGEKQRAIMLEEFGVHNKNIFLDVGLGKTLSKVFYGHNSYEESLRVFCEESDSLGTEAFKHLSGKIKVETMSGERSLIKGSDIVLEINRTPRIYYGVSPSYSVTFGHISEILSETLGVSEKKIAVNRKIVEKAIGKARGIEEKQCLIALSHPGTFSYLNDRKWVAHREVIVPPTIYPSQVSHEPMAPGIFVTVTGIPGLERLYEEAHSLGLKIYTNDPIRVPGGSHLSPHLANNNGILLHFARSGWGSVWLSQLSGNPIVVPEFDPVDDPEIYFNNVCIERLGLGVVYRGQHLDSLIREIEYLKPSVANFNDSLKRRFGTLDGQRSSARLIVKDWLEKDGGA